MLKALWIFLSPWHAGNPPSETTARTLWLSRLPHSWSGSHERISVRSFISCWDWRWSTLLSHRCLSPLPSHSLMSSQIARSLSNRVIVKTLFLISANTHSPQITIWVTRFQDLLLCVFRLRMCWMFQRWDTIDLTLLSYLHTTKDPLLLGIQVSCGVTVAPSPH